MLIFSIKRSKIHNKAVKRILILILYIFFSLPSPQFTRNEDITNMLHPMMCKPNCVTPQKMPTLFS